MPPPRSIPAGVGGRVVAQDESTAQVLDDAPAYWLQHQMSSGKYADRQIPAHELLERQLRFHLRSPGERESTAARPASPDTAISGASPPRPGAVPGWSSSSNRSRTTTACRPCTDSSAGQRFLQRVVKPAVPRSPDNSRWPPGLLTVGREFVLKDNLIGNRHQRKAGRGPSRPGTKVTRSRDHFTALFSCSRSRLRRQHDRKVGPPPLKGIDLLLEAIFEHIRSSAHGRCVLCWLLSA